MYVCPGPRLHLWKVLSAVMFEVNFCIFYKSCQNNLNIFPSAPYIIPFTQKNVTSHNIFKTSYIQLALAHD